MIKSNKGFTLVELIVVITIIGILGTLGFQQVGNQITKTRAQADVSNAAEIAGLINQAIAEEKLVAPTTGIDEQQLFSVATPADGTIASILRGRSVSTGGGTAKAYTQVIPTLRRGPYVTADAADKDFRVSITYPGNAVTIFGASEVQLYPPVSAGTNWAAPYDILN